MVVCSAYGCKSRSDRKQPGITFHRLPQKNRRIRDLWINNMNIKNWEPTANSRLCSKHFTRDSFYTVGMKTCLLNDAIPTIFDKMQPNVELDWKRTKKVKATTENSRDSWEHIIVEYSDTEPTSTTPFEADDEEDCGVLSEHIIVDFSEIMNTNSTDKEDIEERMNGPSENVSTSTKIFINEKQEEDIKFATRQELRKRLYKELVKNKEKSNKIRVLGQKLKRYKHRIMSLQQVLQEFKSKTTEVHRAAAVNRREGGPRRAQIIRNRGVRLRANAHQELEDEDQEGDNEVENEVELPDGKIGAKKRAKLEAKAEKKAARKSEEISRAEKKKKEAQLDEERKKQEEREKAEERKLEEERKKAKEEQERREHEEYLKMKEAFSVEEEGFEEGEGDSQNLLQEFVTYIKNNKVVVIEDLAAHFKLKTQAAIDRIKDLQQDNILTGVIDDRGKFIYVSQEEMEAVAKFIKQRGRVSISELAENSNTLINLVPISGVIAK